MMTRKGLFYLREWWAIVFLFILLGVFSFIGRNFFALKNFSNILYYATTYLLLAAGETFVIITGGIDLSIGFVMGLVAVTSALIMRDLHALGYPQAASIAIGVVSGLILGLIPGIINGILVARLQVPPFIATLGTYGVANGVALNLSKGFPITFLPPKVGEIGNSYLAYILPNKAFSLFQRPENLNAEDFRSLIGLFPTTVVVTAILLLIFVFILGWTCFGQHTYAIGGSSDAAIRAGINVPAHLIKVYLLSAFCASCAGILYVFRSGIGNYTTMNASYELFAIAAVVIGGASLMGGKGSIVGSTIGVLILMILENGLNITGLPTFYRYIATGLILIIAVVIDQFSSETRHREV